MNRDSGQKTGKRFITEGVGTYPRVVHGDAIGYSMQPKNKCFLCNAESQRQGIESCNRRMYEKARYATELSSSRQLWTIK